MHKPIISALTSTQDRPKSNTIYTHICLGSRVDANSEEAASAARVRSGMLKNLFETAAQAESVESNRRKVYNYWREAGGDDDDDDE